ncbi:protein TolQ [Marinomonas mediterranea]|jgi:Cell division and transport-associated protein TolQ (TC 2.C.1.2.1)|uniref:Tol-Pal system protein TolQ n=1 Tax=Marinomonas mediterranea (strain ATCC 700492 / JCM 21426 / NBRC 103028 / MMB-1) TaxID=717774 RepID=F2K2T7_MARM1|nr:protein TolQ [Marinomonas mediterranea]ADZ91220.1 protein TolQ [Marinomonas mediterranea MMB-1]WCN09195.1 protein TolQ [Marinomonas mediterranea]WCN13278.1 protein TolQ [Marinomonas mediterranea]WCN17346.1 protein TolQ [Marinomonas mediterranea MMB-1]
MSIWGLIASASIVVQLVMLTLLLASLFSWIVIFQRVRILKRAKVVRNRFEEQFWSGIDLSKLYKQLTADGRKVEGIENIFTSGIREFTRLRQGSSVEPDAVMEGVARSMRVALYKEEEKLDQHLPFLATVGSISPYIGLFGTVWGIMHSFIGLAQVQQATIATVAPGIAEALIATAIGLAAAIPAVIAYNRFSAGADNLASSYENFSDEFSSILHRKVHSREGASA